MQDFGADLQRARQDAGRSLDDIHNQTRINLKHLRAIERGDFPSLPQTYVRAFIREYARIVGLDEEDTLARYNELAEELRGVPKPPEALDHSHLTPALDDSVEIVPSERVKPRHVEVQGRAEVADDEYVANVRKSKYVSDDHGEAIDIRTTKKDPPPEKPPQAAEDAETAESARDDAGAYGLSEQRRAARAWRGDLLLLLRRILQWPTSAASFVRWRGGSQNGRSRCASFSASGRL